MTASRTPESRARVRIALLGMGRMGRAIDALAANRDCEVVARLGRADMASRAAWSRADFGDADVAIDVTEPDAAIPNAARCLSVGVPVVIGTTGWYDQMPALQQLVRNHACSVLWAPNFSLGVQLMLQLVERAAALLHAAPEFAAHMVETHHAAKRDAPSGTALALRAAFVGDSGRDLPLTSVRTGHVPGTHSLLLDAPFEQLRITHEARDRTVFASGALAAAHWLARSAAGGRPAAVYSMRDVLGTFQPDPDDES